MERKPIAETLGEAVEQEGRNFISPEKSYFARKMMALSPQLYSS